MIWHSARVTWAGAAPTTTMAPGRRGPPAAPRGERGRPGRRDSAWNGRPRRGHPVPALALRPVGIAQKLLRVIPFGTLIFPTRSVGTVIVAGSPSLT